MAHEQLGVKTTVAASFNIEVYIIPKSEQQQRYLESEVNHECATVLPASNYHMRAARKPKDGEILIDLREGSKEENYHCNPSWWSRVYSP